MMSSNVCGWEWVFVCKLTPDTVSESWSDVKVCEWFWWEQKSLNKTLKQLKRMRPSKRRCNMRHESRTHGHKRLRARRKKSDLRAQHRQQLNWLLAKQRHTRYGWRQDYVTEGPGSHLRMCEVEEKKTSIIYHNTNRHSWLSKKMINRRASRTNGVK